MSAETAGSKRLSRRRFVAVMAAGSAALLARPADAVAAAAAPVKPRAAATKPRAAAGALPAAQRKEYDRQLAATVDAVRAIRAHAMPPGTEMASVFRVRRRSREQR
jgi:hypothetical protein